MRTLSIGELNFLGQFFSSIVHTLKFFDIRTNTPSFPFLSCTGAMMIMFLSVAAHELSDYHTQDKVRSFIVNERTVTNDIYSSCLD